MQIVRGVKLSRISLQSRRFSSEFFANNRSCNRETFTPRTICIIRYVSRSKNSTVNYIAKNIKPRDQMPKFITFREFSELLGRLIHWLYRRYLNITNIEEVFKRMSERMPAPTSLWRAKSHLFARQRSLEINFTNCFSLEINADVCCESHMKTLFQGLT